MEESPFAYLLDRYLTRFNREQTQVLTRSRCSPLTRPPGEYHMSDHNYRSIAARRVRLSVVISLILLTIVGGSLTLRAARARSWAQAEPLPVAALPANEQITTSLAERSDQATFTATEVAPDEYVRPSSLWPFLRSAMGVLGDRLEKPSKERLTMAGTLRRDAEAVPFHLILEFPQRLRLQEQERLTAFAQKNRSGETFVPLQLEAVETLVYDTPEEFFGGQARGAAMRHLGSRFRLDAGARADGAISYYDIYEVTGGRGHGGDQLPRSKRYCFNSDTLLLELVKYEIERDGQPVRVEVRLGDWRRVQGQMIPHRIERTENGQSVLLLDIASVTVGPRQEDGAFTVACSN